MRQRGNDGNLRRSQPQDSDGASLATLPPGERARVTSVNGGGGLVQRAASMGIIPGTELEIVRGGSRGPIIVRVHESRIALGRGMANRILVRQER